MGTKLSKIKNVSTSITTNEQHKETDVTTKDTNNHVDVTTNKEIKQSEKKTTKKKKEQKSSKKSLKTKVDKSTSTDGCLSSTSMFVEQRFGDSVLAVSNHIPSATMTAQVNAAYQPETPNSDVQQLREACAQHGIIYDESIVVETQSTKESENHEDTLITVDEATTEVVPEVVTDNSDTIKIEEQQALQS